MVFGSISTYQYQVPVSGTHKDQEKQRFPGSLIRWNSQKQLSGPVEQKRRRNLLYPHPKFSLGLVPYRPLLYSRCTYVRTYIVCKKNDVLDYLCFSLSSADHESTALPPFRKTGSNEVGTLPPAAT